jgi:hypothetical protein
MHEDVTCAPKANRVFQDAEIRFPGVLKGAAASGARRAEPYSTARCQKSRMYGTAGWTSFQIRGTLLFFKGSNAGYPVV